MNYGCLNPVRIKYKGTYKLVPCGKCAACLSKRANTWCNRIKVESSQHKYVWFVTLTYNDGYVPKFYPAKADTYPYLTDLQRSNVIDYISENEVSDCYLVLRYQDIQGFLKRLRSYIYDNPRIPSYEKTLRYYVCGEYGETTKRPHYHILFFSDCDDLFRPRYFGTLFDLYLHKAWSTKVKVHPDGESAHWTRFSFGHIKSEQVRDNASRYVSSYVTATGSLPQLLQMRGFRPFSIASKNPPLGSYKIDTEACKKILFEGLDTYVNEQGNEFDGNFVIPLFKSLKDKIFPKCYQYSQLSSSDRFILYGIARFPNRDSTFQDFLGYLDSRPTLINKICQLLEIDDYELLQINSESYSRVKRQWYQSRLLLNQCSMFGLHLSQYVALIEAFYSNQDYKRLVKQLQFEEDFSREYSAKFLPSFLDPLIFDCSSVGQMQRILESFGFTDLDDPVFYNFQQLQPYQDWKSSLESYIYNGKMYKAIKDYQVNHGYSNVNVL